MGCWNVFLGHPISPTGGQQCIQSREGDGTDNLDTNCKENRNQSIDQKCFHAKILTYFRPKSARNLDQYGMTVIVTDGPTDQWTDGSMDQRIDIASDLKFFHSIVSIP